MEEKDRLTHVEHCCSTHGCKYGDENCPVFDGSYTQAYPCEHCSEHGLITTEPTEAQPSVILPNDTSNVEVGQWYWAPVDDGTEMACVMHIGSNYVKLQFRSDAGFHSSIRVLSDEFPNLCKRIDDPDTIIQNQINRHQVELTDTLRKIKDLTARLSISPSVALQSGSETRALSLRGSDQPVEEYKAALSLAHEKELPELFEQVKKINASMSRWMLATTLPMEAQVDALRPAVDRIRERIFSVELYAGLAEKIVQIQDGDAAPNDTKIHLHQRRCYMDEECLANYQTGGMDFRNIVDFDRWIALPENRDRILPFPRSVVAFRVRRHEQEREWKNLADYIRVLEDRECDNMTFLYIRNGDQLSRMSTKIDFGHRLFPDMNDNPMGKKVYARVRAGHVMDIITEGQHSEMVETECLEIEENNRKAAAADENDRWKFRNWSTRESLNYHEFSTESVYYDDILSYLQKQMNEHNRLVLVLQGLLDRSPVFHPHPTWSLWDPVGFHKAMELLYDDARALTAGEAPDFEAYRTHCNKSLQDGSIVVGQEEIWERSEAEKENNRIQRSLRSSSSDFRYSRYRPYGDPGPGSVARILKYHPKKKTATFAWVRDRQSRTGENGVVRCTFTCSSSRLLNVDAYTIGDFRRFFDDPRTRADYLKWAPLLLEAEEYHAGNRPVAPIPAPTPPKASSYSGRLRYAQRKLQKMMKGKAVRLVHDIPLKNGETRQCGTLWRIIDGKGSHFDVRSIDADGNYSKDRLYTYGLSASDFEEIPEMKAVP